MGRTLLPSILATLLITCTAVASSATTPGLVSVTVPKHPSVLRNVQVSFRPHGRLPRGGYYFAVLVLQNYERASKRSPPQCALSSDMKKTDYGYPHGRGSIRLTLAPAKSAENNWCPGGVYAGAIYAVPHKPPCNASYPCYGRQSVTSPCWELEGGHTVCGVVAMPELTQAEREAKAKEEREVKEKAERETKTVAEREAKEKAELEARDSAPYSYPGGLPTSRDRSTRIVGYFRIQF
jgi:hypothetical protein